MEMTKQEYGKLVKRMSPPSPKGKHILSAFLVGGAICCLGQGLKDLYSLWLEEEMAGMLVSVTLVFLGALLTGLNVYDNIARIAGAGTLVPITGFANSIAASALEFKTEGLVTGTAVKMFSIAGPVIVFGISASIVYGMLYWFFTTVL